MPYESPRRVGDLLDHLDRSGACAETVTIRDIVEAMDERSHASSLLVPALLDMSPLGAIPGVPTVLAAFLFGAAAQIALGRRHLWLPAFLGNCRIGSSRVRSAVSRFRRPARWLDRQFHGRFPILLATPFVRAAGCACMGLAVAMPPLELLPLATTLATAPIATFGLSLLFRDGLLMMIGFVMAIAAVGGVLFTVAG